MLRKQSIENPKSLLPTGTCFDDAMDMLAEYVVRGVTKDIRLVHGFCCWARRPYAHAWIELGNEVYEGKFMAGDRVFMIMPKTAFYKDMVITEPTRYDVAEVAQLTQEHGNYGPWDYRYKKALAQSKSDMLIVESDPMLENTMVTLTVLDMDKIKGMGIITRILADTRMREQAAQIYGISDSTKLRKVREWASRSWEGRERTWNELLEILGCEKKEGQGGVVIPYNDQGT